MKPVMQNYWDFQKDVASLKAIEGGVKKIWDGLKDDSLKCSASDLFWELRDVVFKAEDLATTIKSAAESGTEI